MEDGVWVLVPTSGLDLVGLLYGRGFAASFFGEYKRIERSGREKWLVNSFRQGRVLCRSGLPANLKQVFLEAIEARALSNPLD